MAGLVPDLLSPWAAASASSAIGGAALSIDNTVSGLLQLSLGHPASDASTTSCSWNHQQHQQSSGGGLVAPRMEASPPSPFAIASPSSVDDACLAIHDWAGEDARPGGGGDKPLSQKGSMIDRLNDVGKRDVDPKDVPNLLPQQLLDSKSLDLGISKDSYRSRSDDHAVECTEPASAETKTTCLPARPPALEVGDGDDDFDDDDGCRAPPRCSATTPPGRSATYPPGPLSATAISHQARDHQGHGVGLQRRPAVGVGVENASAAEVGGKSPTSCCGGGGKFGRTGLAAPGGGGAGGGHSRSASEPACRIGRVPVLRTVGFGGSAAGGVCHLQQQQQQRGGGGGGGGGGSGCSRRKTHSKAASCDFQSHRRGPSGSSPPLASPIRPPRAAPTDGKKKKRKTRKGKSKEGGVATSATGDASTGSKKGDGNGNSNGNGESNSECNANGAKGKAAKAVSKGEVKRLVRYQVWVGRPIRTPWYRERPRGSKKKIETEASYCGGGVREDSNDGGGPEATPRSCCSGGGGPGEHKLLAEMPAGPGGPNQEALSPHGNCMDGMKGTGFFCPQIPPKKKK